MSSAWTGSGTIVDPSGIILTNCHVASPREMGMSAPPADRLAIAVTERSDEPPAISYFAEVLATDPRLDLAVVRIVADVRGRPVRGQLFPSVPLGDSDKLELGDRLAIFGYPGIGGDTVTYTSGNVSGFTAESGVRSHRGWIKTDATIAGGNSGGTAVDEAGRLVGIPTQAAAGTGVTPVDARPGAGYKSRWRRRQSRYTDGCGRIHQRPAAGEFGAHRCWSKPAYGRKPRTEPTGHRSSSPSRPGNGPHPVGRRNSAICCSAPRLPTTAGRSAPVTRFPPAYRPSTRRSSTTAW